MPKIQIFYKTVGVSAFLAVIVFTPARLAAQAADPMLHPIGELPSCAVDFGEFRENLENCTPYKCAFPDIFFSGYPVREILGQVGDVCSYTQEIPWGYFADCLLDGKARSDVLYESEYLVSLIRRSADENLITRTEIDTSQNEGGVKMFLGDEEIIYPSRGLNTAIDSGHCEVQRMPE